MSQEKRHIFKFFIEFTKQIKPDTKKRIARYLIITGIIMAYAPYWMKLFVEIESSKIITETVVSAGWWVLATGLILYAVNTWLDIKADKKEKVD